MLNAHERASISFKCRHLVGMVNLETSAQKELRKTRMKRDETDVLKLCQTLQSWSNSNIWAVIWLVLGFCCFFGINVRPSKRVWKGKIWYITERLIQKSTDIFKTLKRKSLLTFLKKEIKGKQIMADKNNKILRTDAKKNVACLS